MVVAPEGRLDYIDICSIIRDISQTVLARSSPKPCIAMPALFTTMSMPSGCSLSKKCPISLMLSSLLMSNPWYLIVLKPPSFARAFAVFNCASSSRTLTALSPRPWSRAVKYISRGSVPLLEKLDNGYWRARFRTIARPMPLFAPVTMAVREVGAMVRY